MKIKDPKKLFFTADSHFGHCNVPKFDKSPWWSEKAQEISSQISVEKDRSVSEQLRNQEYSELRLCSSAQDEAIIKNWNSVVPEDGIVFHLGDFTFYKDEKPILNILNRLNGEIYLINGNHEQGVHKNLNVKSKFSLIRDYMEILVGTQKIMMFHYPIHEWNQAHRGSWMLHGHTHINDDYDTQYKRVNVGLMNWDYFPVSYSQLQIVMAEKVNKEHH